MKSETHMSAIWQDASGLFSSSTLGNNSFEETGEIRHGDTTAVVQFIVPSVDSAQPLTTSMQYRAIGTKQLLGLSIGSSIDEWTLTPGGIYYSQKYIGNWPIHSSHWSAGLHDLDERGRLQEFTIKLEPGWVVYSKLRNWKASPARDLPDVPTTLQKETQVLGFDINWRIDYDAKAKEILESSKLADIVRTS